MQIRSLALMNEPLNLCQPLSVLNSNGGLTAQKLKRQNSIPTRKCHANE